MLSIDDLTLDEKIDLVTGSGMWHTKDLNGKLDSCLLCDGPHGLRKQDENAASNNESVRATCFPTASALACGWDQDLASLEGKSIAKEAAAEGVTILLGPGTNIKRSPLCGRNFEYYSEDPHLAGKMATGFIKGVQSEKVGTSLKHFAANNQETKRMTSNSRIDERTLREIYLSAFEMAVTEAQPGTIMASYNQLNGRYACENKWLLTDVLRNEWGFEGLVMSDWGASTRLSESIKAGMDLEMPDSHGNHAKLLKAFIESGEVPIEDLDRAVSKILEMSDKYYRRIDEEALSKKNELLSKNHETAVDIETKCAVLLENNGILPINKNDFAREGIKHLLLVGGMAENVRFQGGGSSHITTDDVMTALEAFENAGINAYYKKGYDANSAAINLLMEDEAIKAAKAQAEEGLPVLFFGGLTDFAEGEGYDRKSLSMPDNQISLLRKICEVNKNTIFVAFGGSPFDMSPADGAAAIIMMYLGGEGVMEAVVKLITGEVNPSGKLAETFPLRLEDTPAYGNFATSSRNVDYREGLFVGYRHYDSFGIKTRYPFGFGRSYTDFEYKTMVASVKDNEVKVTITVKNTGETAGAEVVQVYVKNPETGGLLRAKRELRGFDKIYLEPKEEKKAEVILPKRAFSIYDVKQHCWAVVPGIYKIEAAASVSDVRLTAEVEIEADGIPYGPALTFEELVGDMGDLDNVKAGEYSIQNSLGQLSQRSLLGKIVLNKAKKEVYNMFPQKSHEDPEVMMYAEGVMEGTLDSVINESGGMLSSNIAQAIVDEANGHKLRAFGKILLRK